MKQHRILIATDVPFWRKSTGAQTRISSLVDFLISESFVVRTFYLGQTNSEQFTDNDRQLIASQELDVQQQSSDQVPKSWVKKIGWYANQIRPKLSSDQAANKPVDQANAETLDSEPAANGSLCLEDFRWPWARQAFLDSVKQFQPDSILIEYVKLSYLIDDLSSQQRNSIHCVIDTHDALHLRNQRFKERGLVHWIEISREEEAKELDKFDTVLAIQTDEAELFKTMAPHAKTIVCGHIPNTKPANQSGDNQKSTLPPTSTQPEILSIGYLASTNDSNFQAIDSFIDSVWRPLKQQLSQETGSQSQPAIELVIGGSICKLLAPNQSTDPNIRLLGHVESLAGFYNSVDVVINPVEFGTGLKIKSVEGLAFGKPLISTAEGVVGLEQISTPPTQGARAIVICHTPDQFVSELKRLILEPSRLAALSEAANKLAQSAFSQQQAYRPLKQLLLQGK